MTAERVVHVTERTAWKTCRQYHQFSYTLGLVPFTRSVGPMWFGVGVHYALATYYKYGTHPVLTFDQWFKDQVSQMNLDDAQHNKAEELHLLGNVMLDGYLPWAREHDNFEVVSVEQELRYEVAPGLVIAGTLDLLVRDLTSRKLWVVDHKTARAFIDPEALVFDDQMVVYLWLVWKVYNEVPAGAMYSMLRKKIPATPYVLKSGGLSKARDIDTTQDVYLRAIYDNNLNPQDYLDVLDRLASNEFYRRERIGRSRRELQLLDTQIRDEVCEMTRPDAPVFPTLTQDCLMSCQYRDLCRTRYTGGDVGFMIDQHYQRITDYDARWAETHPRETGEG